MSKVKIALLVSVGVVACMVLPALAAYGVFSVIKSVRS